MCGILAIFGSSLSEADLRKVLIENARKYVLSFRPCPSVWDRHELVSDWMYMPPTHDRLRHRGPDWSGYKVGPGHPQIAANNPT